MEQRPIVMITVGFDDFSKELLRLPDKRNQRIVRAAVTREFGKLDGHLVLTLAVYAVAALERFANVSAIHHPKDQAEQQAQKQACHQREIEGHIIPLDDDVAGQPSQPDPIQIGPKQADQQDRKAEHDQEARHHG
jgi:hypothetical protein